MQIKYSDILISNVLIPLYDKNQRYHVRIKNGKIFSVTSVDQNLAAQENTAYDMRIECMNNSLELWPTYVENHAHLALPTNFDNFLEPMEIVALQYLYFGITQVMDLFGYPSISKEWDAMMENSHGIAPTIMHCGYALTAPTLNDKVGHGAEFPLPVYVVNNEADILSALEKNVVAGAQFIKLMYTAGIEKPGDLPRFSLLQKEIFSKILMFAKQHDLECIVDCNTLEEVKFAVRCGYRYFAHPIRDVILTEEDWNDLKNCYFVTTLQGLKGMVMTGNEMEQACDTFHFHQTQLPGQEKHFATVTMPYGIQYGMQNSRLHALNCMRENSIAALLRNQCVLGSDAGNTLSYHGLGFYEELLYFLQQKSVTRHNLLIAATQKIPGIFEKKLTNDFSLDNEANINLIESNELLPTNIIKGDIILTPHLIANKIETLRHSL